MRYEYLCEICGRHFEESRVFEERYNVFCCGQRAVKLVSLPSTTKDKAYEFTTEMFNGKPVEIRSKDQFKRMLKKHGIADASPRECFQQAYKCRKNNEISRENDTKKRAKVLADKMRESGVIKEGKEILTKLCKSGRR